MNIFKNLSNRIKKNNKGSALIVCIIVLLFVSILATVILYMAGINYRMKKSELNTKISFYTGEEPLERIQSNLIVPLSETMNNAYMFSSSQYARYGTPDERRRHFYTTFAEYFKDFIIANYGGTDIGDTAASGSDFVKNVLHNLTYFDTADCANGVPVTDIIINDGDIIPDNNYENDPIAFYNDLVQYGIENDTDLFPGNADGSPKIYLLATGTFDQGGTASDNYDHLVRLYVTDYPKEDLTRDPIEPAGPLNDPDKCRLVFKNIVVVLVQNGYTSVIATDIAMEFPPLDWGGGASTSGYNNWNIYQLLYYVNWKRN